MSEQATLKLHRCCTPVVDIEYDTDGTEDFVETLVGALARADGIDMTAVPPVYEAIDLDAVRQLFERDDSAEMVLGFTVGDWNVFVNGDGRIRVCDGTRYTDPEPVFDGPLV